MKKKILIMTAVCVVLFVAVIAAALNAVFTVTEVRVLWRAPFSEEGEEEVYELQGRLEDAFVGSSTTFLNLSDVAALVSEYPFLELESAEKSYPQRLLLQISERREVFAFQRENGRYAVLDAEGRYLGDKDSNLNRFGGENILLVGFSLTQDGAGFVTGELFDEALAFVSCFAAELEDVRANILSIELGSWGVPSDPETLFRVRMREGVSIEISSPEVHTEEKMRTLLAEYLLLSETERTHGFLNVTDVTGSEEFTVSYSQDPVFVS